MVAKTDVMTAAEKVREALASFVLDRAEARVLVGINEWGNVQAVVASHGFEHHSKDEIRELLREHLRREVPPELLTYLYRIDVLTRTEYDSRYTRSEFLGGVTEIVQLDPDAGELNRE